MISEKDFYKRRNSRSNVLAPVSEYQKKITGVTISSEMASTYQGQVMVLTCMNLLARWSTNLSGLIPDLPLVDQLKSKKFSTLHQRIMHECKEANPYIKIDLNHITSESLVLNIGLKTYKDVIPDYCITIDGWDVVAWDPDECESVKLNNEKHFIPAAQVASCLGVAQIFKMAVDQDKEDLLQSFRWSMWNYNLASLDNVQVAEPSIPSSKIYLGNILQVGVGAVGSNVLYFLSMLDSGYKMKIVDYDKVEVENLDRSLLFGISDIEQKKVNRAKVVMGNYGIAGVEVFDGSWNEFVSKEISLNDFDLWLALANEDNVWQSMAENLPPIVIQATTNYDWGVTLGRHIPFEDFCLRCRFEPDDESVTTICSASEIEQESNGQVKKIHASLPFLSALSASMIISELMKVECDRIRTNPNYVELNLKSSMSHILKFHKTPSKDCPVCANKSKKMWHKLYNGSHYEHLTD
jgi:hypothetical protein